MQSIHFSSMYGQIHALQYIVPFMSNPIIKSMQLYVINLSVNENVSQLVHCHRETVQLYDMVVKQFEQVLKFSLNS